MNTEGMRVNLIDGPDPDFHDYRNTAEVRYSGKLLLHFIFSFSCYQQGISSYLTYGHNYRSDLLQVTSNLKKIILHLSGTFELTRSFFDVFPILTPFISVILLYMSYTALFVIKLLQTSRLNMQNVDICERQTMTPQAKYKNIKHMVLTCVTIYVDSKKLN